MEYYMGRVIYRTTDPDDEIVDAEEPCDYLCCVGICKKAGRFRFTKIVYGRPHYFCYQHCPVVLGHCEKSVERKRKRSEVEDLLNWSVKK